MYFTEFLKSQYCDENISFYNAVLALRKTTNEDAIFKRCKTIYKQFICISSPTEVRNCYYKNYNLYNFSTCIALFLFKTMKKES